MPVRLSAAKRSGHAVAVVTLWVPVRMPTVIANLYGELMPTEPNHIAHVMKALAKRMRADSEASEIIKHAGTRGRRREKIVREFLQTYLPGHIRTSHGAEIVAASGKVKVSSECDIVLFDRSTPPFLGGDEGGVVPNECVYGAVEVKTSLSKPKLIEACENLRRVKLMRKTAYRPGALPPRYRQNGKEYNYFPTIGVIFAFGGPGLQSTADNLRAWMADKPPEEWPDSVWVLGKGYIVWWDPNLGRVDLPSSIATPMILDADPELDILLPFVLHLNIVFGHATMAPLLLTEYLPDIRLGHNPRIWTDE